MSAHFELQRANGDHAAPAANQLPAAAPRPGPLAIVPTAQSAAMAAGGFLAGAVLMGLVHRRRRRAQALAKPRRPRRVRAAARGSRPATRASELVQIVGSRSLLVDVHLLGDR